MPIGIFGATTTVELGERVRTGEIAVDLYRPTHLLLWWMSVDFGRAMFQLIVRGGAPLLVGSLVFDLKFPSGAITWIAVAAGLTFGILVSFCIRYLVALSGFWIVDSRGMEALGLMLSLFFSGDDPAAGGVPRLDRRVRPGDAVGGDPAGADRHLARPQSRRDRGPRWPSSSAGSWCWS